MMKYTMNILNGLLQQAKSSSKSFIILIVKSKIIIIFDIGLWQTLKMYIPNTLKYLSR